MNRFQQVQQKVQQFFAELPHDRKKKVLVISIAVVLILGIAGGVAARYYFGGQATGELVDSLKDKKKAQKVKKPKPTTIPRRIDGVVVAREKANPVLACVMIENAGFGGVRPQAGLSKASVVYEVIVEGGITRLMAVFPQTQVESENPGDDLFTIGPVRSARDTYLEFASELNCAYAHAGGSDTSLYNISAFKMRDIEGLREGKYFWREPKKYAPHNYFTATDKLTEAIKNHNWANEEPPTYTSWKFAQPIAVEQRPDKATEEGVEKISIAFGGNYDVDYNYIPEKNVFERSNGGELQTDEVNNETLTTSNVIIQHVGSGIPIEGKGRINWPVHGEGAVEIFHDGRVFKGTWKKPDRVSRTQFFDETGKEIPLLRGNSWVEIVPEHITVSYE